MAESNGGSPNWARGYEVESLKAVTAVVKAHDEGMVDGGFGRYSERNLAEDLQDGHVVLGPLLDGRPSYVIVARLLSRRLGVRDFTGESRLRLDIGVGLIQRLAWQGPARGDAGVALREALQHVAGQRPIAVEAWQEHPGERLLVEALGLELAAVKIKASSEMRGVYVPAGTAPPPYPPHQAVGLARLPMMLSSANLGALVDEVRELAPDAYAQHYSSYNARGSWTALALRGFYDDPARIEKPAEMNRQVKREHPDELDNEPRDTQLRAALPAVEAILDALPAQEFERVRLMALAPGGGELERHADIMDADAGAAEGKLARLHIPLVTNEKCMFSGWDLNGVARSGSMKRGGVYYLDVRKPHTAVNEGETPRIHLVVDAVCSAETVRALAGAHEFEPLHEQAPVGT